MVQGFSIVICGAGVAGLSLGLRLRQLGLAPLIIEKQRGVRPQTRGELLQPSAVEALKGLGLSAPLLSEAQPIVRISHAYLPPFSGTRERYEFTYPADQPALAIRHDRLLLLLRDEYLRLGGILLEDVYVRDLTQLDRKWMIDLSSGEEIEADCFIGADGRYSITRRMAGLPIQESPLQRTLLACLVETEVPAGELRSEEIPGGVLVYYRHSPGLARAYLCLQASDSAEVNEDRERFAREKLATSSLGPTISFADIPVLIPSSDLHLPVRSKGRAVWVAEAAGVLDPLLGNGIALALRESLALADAIRQASQHPEMTPELLQRAGAAANSSFQEARQLALIAASVLLQCGRWQRVAKWALLRGLRPESSISEQLLRLGPEVLKIRSLRALRPLV